MLGEITAVDILTVLAISFVLLAILAGSKTVVVFYDYDDVIATMMVPGAPFIAMISGGLIGIMGAFFGIEESSSELIGYVFIWIGVLIGVACGLYSIFLAVRYNKSLWIGIPVGVMKISIAIFLVLLFFVLFVIPFLEKNKSGRKGNWMLGLAMTVGIAVLMFRLFVNGEEVYDQKGWQPATHVGLHSELGISLRSLLERGSR